MVLTYCNGQAWRRQNFQKYIIDPFEFYVLIKVLDCFMYWNRLKIKIDESALAASHASMIRSRSYYSYEEVFNNRSQIIMIVEGSIKLSSAVLPSFLILNKKSLVKFVSELGSTKKTISTAIFVAFCKNSRYHCTSRKGNVRWLVMFSTNR